MTNQELYINGALVDLPRDVGVRINRALINPSELNAKDAQFSYSITLPPTAVNSAAFSAADVEETKNKFNRTYRAQYIVDGVRVFDGRFRMSEVSARGFKGNLYVPDRKSIKDIFGELKLTDNAPFEIPFLDFVPSVNSYNLAAVTSPQAAIFPYVMYGVLPKVPLDKNANNYSPRNVWDSSVRIGIQDLPPSINPMLMLRHIFESQGYDLQGSAFDDDRLTRLYMSYKNAPERVQPWNYGQHAKIRVRGFWGSRQNWRTGLTSYERGVNQGQGSGGAIFATDLLDAVNTSLDILEDKGGNVLYKEVNDADGVTWINGQIRIPASGFYKVEFDASVHVSDQLDWRHTDAATGVQHIGGRTANVNNWFVDNPFEVRLCRDWGKGADFGLGSPKLNGVFYYDNQPQNLTFDENNVPKYFPQVNADGQVNFVDLAQDRGHLLGFAFGKHEGGSENREYINPRDTTNKWSQILAAKPAQSWDAASASEDPTRLAIKSAGWWKYGRIGSFDNAGDNPDTNLDYSGGPFANGKVLDANGNPQDPNLGNLAVRVNGYGLNSLTGFQTPNAAFDVTDFIDLALYTNLKFSGTFSDAGNGMAIVAYYDINLQYIGFGELAPITGAPSVTFTNEPLTAPNDAAFVRLLSEVATPMSVTANSAATGNVILHRFPLQRYFTYVLTAPAGHSGYVYIHNGAANGYTERVDFVNGVATFNTSFYPLVVFEPRITLYLKTPNFDINGTLVISRKIEESSADVIDWELTNKYAINLQNAPENFARRGQYMDSTGLDANWYAQGKASAVVWLNAGELLTVASVSSEGRYRRNGMHSTFGWVAHELAFNLSVQPFRVDRNWLKVSQSGNGTGPMDWNDAPNFATDRIDLVQFLNVDMRTDEFIDNFVKAFNLKLSQIGEKTFSLDLKQTRQSVSSLSIDLDNVASVRDRVNSPLGLPSLYKIGFTINADEQGFVETQDDGGGTFSTGATEENVVEQKSNFSYNWFKNITQGAATLPLPLVSKSEVWNPLMSYPDAMAKKYTDLPYRFWYFDGQLNDIGGVFKFNNEALTLAKVSNEIAGVNILNYKNARFTLLDNYFTVLINGASHYTEVEAYITPAQYKALNGAILAKFNGDLYYIAELSGYDPTGRNKTKIKLIRRI